MLVYKIGTHHDSSTSEAVLLDHFTIEARQLDTVSNISLSLKVQCLKVPHDFPIKFSIVKNTISWHHVKTLPVPCSLLCNILLASGVTRFVSPDADGQQVSPLMNILLCSGWDIAPGGGYDDAPLPHRWFFWL